MEQAQIPSAPPTQSVARTELSLWLERLLGEEGHGEVLLSVWPDLRRMRGLPPQAIRDKSALPMESCRRLWAALGLLDSISDPRRHSGRIIGTPEQAAEVLGGLRLHPEERFWVMALGSECELLAVREIARGSPARCPVSPRMVFQFLMDVGAHRGILAHHHPQGSCLPSEEDVALTRRLKRLGAQLELPIADHIILARDGFFSFQTEGVLFARRS